MQTFIGLASTLVSIESFKVYSRLALILGHWGWFSDDCWYVQKERENVWEVGLCYLNWKCIVPYYKSKICLLIWSCKYELKNITGYYTVLHCILAVSVLPLSVLALVDSLNKGLFVQAIMKKKWLQKYLKSSLLSESVAHLT